MRITIVVIAALIVVFGGIYIYNNPAASTAPADGGMVACTMEAKMCPDGSYVGRTGPKCEFSACPGASTSTAQ